MLCLGAVQYAASLASPGVDPRMIPGMWLGIAIDSKVLQCVLPENYLPPPEIIYEGRGGLKTKISKGKYEAKLEFLEGGRDSN